MPSGPARTSSPAPRERAPGVGVCYTPEGGSPESLPGAGGLGSTQVLRGTRSTVTLWQADIDGVAAGDAVHCCCLSSSTRSVAAASRRCVSVQKVIGSDQASNEDCVVPLMFHRFLDLLLSSKRVFPSHLLFPSYALRFSHCPFRLLL